jgi:hypothetical protein
LDKVVSWQYVEIYFKRVDCDRSDALGVRGVICCVYYKIGFALKLQKINYLPDKSYTPGLEWNW